MHAEGYVEQIIGYAKTQLNAEQHKDHWAVRQGGYISMILLGIFPGPSTRFIGIIICRAMNWRSGLLVLAVANIIRVAYLLGLISIIWKSIT